MGTDEERSALERGRCHAQLAYVRDVGREGCGVDVGRGRRRAGFEARHGGTANGECCVRKSGVVSDEKASMERCWTEFVLGRCDWIEGECLLLTCPCRRLIVGKPVGNSGISGST
jgi:hypothetical protein